VAKARGMDVNDIKGPKGDVMVVSNKDL